MQKDKNTGFRSAAEQDGKDARIMAPQKEGTFIKSCLSGMSVRLGEEDGWLPVLATPATAPCSHSTPTVDGLCSCT